LTASADAPSPKAISRSTLPPDAGGILLAISRIGYQLQEALADLVDNSIDAGATTVLIRFFRNGDRLTDLALVDNGRGMDEATLEEAMRFGSRIKKTGRDLGKYGMGLKAASLSNADTLIVISRQRGAVAGRRWTKESIRAGWKLEKLDPDGAERVLGNDWDVLETAPSGTVVLWERIPRFQAAGGTAGRRFAALSKEIAKHLGLVFHRYLQDERIRIFLDLHDASGETGLKVAVEPLNPFPATSGLRGYPADFRTTLGVYGNLMFHAHLWPPKSPDPGYKLGGKVAQRQGFYFFRNDRLIQAGGWNGWRDDAEPHSSLARVEVDLSSKFDDAFAISVQKSAIDAPPGFLDAVEAARSGRTTLSDYIRDAIELYRTAETPGGRNRPMVSKGLRRQLRKRLETAIGADGASSGIELRWSSELRSDEAFRIDSGSRVIELNEMFRPLVLGGGPASAGDAPVFKTLLFLLLGDDALRERRSERVAERHRLLNACLVAALDDLG
jgi:hypothetical protein